MSVLLSDHLRATRDALQKKEAIGLYLLPGRLGALLKRFNTLLYMAEQQEEELRIALSQAGNVDVSRGATILRFPKRLVIVMRSDDGGDAA